MSGRGVDKAFGWSCTVALSALSVWGHQTVPWMGLPLAVNMVRRVQLVLRALMRA